MTTSFGEVCRNEEFLLQKDAIFLNHGSYGTVPRQVLNSQRALVDKMESHPDAWYRFHNPFYWKRALKRAAEFIRSRVDNLVFVQNATTGINAVLRAIQFTANDVILVNPWTYSAVKNATMYTCDRLNTVLKSVDIKFPISSSESILEMYREVLDTTPNVRLVVVDHISSGTAVLFPVKELVDMCRSRDLMILVDGAHAPGQIPLNLEELEADFYIGNFHKWLFSPRGCAILWVHPEHHAIMRGPIISHYYKHPTFQYDFFSQGTTDQSSFYASFDGIEFYNRMGGHDVISAYNKGLLDCGVARLCALWGTSEAPVSKDCQAPFMRLVLLPDMKAYPKTPVGGRTLTIDLYREDGIQTHIALIDGSLWMRLSVQIYVTLNDFENLGHAVVNRTKLDANDVVIDESEFDPCRVLDLDNLDM